MPAIEPKLLNRPRALEIMARSGLDALVATTPENVLYISDYGLEGPFHTGREHHAAVLPLSGDRQSVLVVEEFELPAIAEGHTWCPDVRVAHSGYIYVPDNLEDQLERRVGELVGHGRTTPPADPIEVVARALQEMGLGAGRIAMDQGSTIREMGVRGLLPDAELVYGRDIFREIRVVKTQEEIRRLRGSNRILETAFKAVINVLEPGATCGRLIECFRVTMAGQGAYGSHMTYGGGVRPWVGFTDLGYKLKAGDIVFVDPAGEWRHYWSDTGRTAVVGEPNQKLERLYAGLRTCHETVARELAPGASFGSLSAIARKVVDPDVRRGFMVLFHSMGLEQYDHPRTSTEFGGGGLTLETDMVVNFETLYFELGWGVLQLEDTYLITTGDAEKIGTLPRDLVVV